MKKKLNIEEDEYKLKDKLLDVGCDTCIYYEDFINTSFYCPKFIEIKADNGKTICKSWKIMEHLK